MTEQEASDSEGDNLLHTLAVWRFSTAPTNKKKTVADEEVESPASINQDWCG